MSILQDSFKGKLKYWVIQYRYTMLRINNSELVNSTAKEF